ncbi:helix-turn-helix domain-containing protein [Clostridioides difficile]|nr:helix-turn-helix domain-containing protein [Clostridioides difficile]MCL6901994.1 helix-turn-helix domain-containing protein [Clostridioides difficile]MCP3377826.1 helix-turn-helix domain-containing protein [Clostridioides difficile]MDE3493456.1 helix-turn-helix domain-containing protein [Clostridioides difficile]MDE3707893.1 helix-turn-helix domain-containing protein [Clostridioides difficile]
MIDGIDTKELNTINKRIKKIRELEGLSQEEFAKKIDLSQNHLSGMENGKKKVMKRTIITICSIFNINKEWLKNGTGDIYNPVEENTLNSSDKNKELIDMIYSLDEEDQKVLTLMIENLYNKAKKIREEKE